MKTIAKKLFFIIAIAAATSQIFAISFADAYVSVNGHFRNGKYISPHVRSNPNGLKYDNYGYKPSQGLYNKTYGTRGSSWNTPTWITDPDYYTGESLYESNKSGSSYSITPSVPTTKQAVTNPPNSYIIGSIWYCNSGYKKIDDKCQEVINPSNSYVYGSSWYCNSGYKKVGDSCIKIQNPPNSYVYGSTWYCNSDYKKVGDECQKIYNPPNSYIWGSTWYCNTGYKKIGDSCEKIDNPPNSYVWGSTWYCNSGYKKVGVSCEKINNPPNSYIWGSNWYCYSGYIRSDQSCLPQ